MDGRDRSVLQLVAEGESYEEAASRLRLDLTGIERAMARIRHHLGANTDEHAVALALRAHLID